MTAAELDKGFEHFIPYDEEGAAFKDDFLMFPHWQILDGNPNNQELNTFTFVDDRRVYSLLVPKGGRLISFVGAPRISVINLDVVPSLCYILVVNKYNQYLVRYRSPGLRQYNKPAHLVVVALENDDPGIHIPLRAITRRVLLMAKGSKCRVVHYPPTEIIGAVEYSATSISLPELHHRLVCHTYGIVEKSQVMVQAHPEYNSIVRLLNFTRISIKQAYARKMTIPYSSLLDSFVADFNELNQIDNQQLWSPYVDASCHFQLEENKVYRIHIAVEEIVLFSIGNPDQPVDYYVQVDNGITYILVCKKNDRFIVKCGTVEEAAVPYAQIVVITGDGPFIIPFRIDRFASLILSNNTQVEVVLFLPYETDLANLLNVYKNARLKVVVSKDGVLQIMERMTTIITTQLPHPNLAAVMKVVEAQEEFRRQYSEHRARQAQQQIEQQAQ